MKKKYVLGNWKMHGCTSSISTLLRQLLENMPKILDVECVVLPPAIYIPEVSNNLKGSTVCWGAQNVFPASSGAYTGEISGPMLKDYGCSYVLVGHSERRHFFKENEKFIAEKFHHVKEHGMIPVLCLGETLQEHEQGLAQEVVAKQLLALTSSGKETFHNCIIAYEPVWAIGTGKTATAEYAQSMHAFIRAFVAEYEQNAASNLPILYGGSVNEKNAKALFSEKDIDGGLVGGASLNALQFVEIVKCIN